MYCININLVLYSLQSSQSNSDYIHNNSTSSSDDQKFFDIKDNNLLEKCPVCFMTFPLSTTNRDRTKHVGEHYTDD